MQPPPKRRLEIPAESLRQHQSTRLALLQLLEDRYAKRSTIIASQLPVSKWHEYLADPTLADAIMDRNLSARGGSPPTPKGSNPKDPHCEARIHKRNCNFIMFLETLLKVVTFAPELVVTYGRNNQTHTETKTVNIYLVACHSASNSHAITSPLVISMAASSVAADPVPMEKGNQLAKQVPPYSSSLSHTVSPASLLFTVSFSLFTSTYPQNHIRKHASNMTTEREKQIVLRARRFKLILSVRFFRSILSVPHFPILCTSAGIRDGYALRPSV